MVQTPLEFPATVKAGLVALTLTNSDTVPRSAQLIRVEGEQTVEDVLKVVNADETKIPDFIQDGGGTGAVKPGATTTATQNLAPGRYVIWDDQGGDEEGAKGNDGGIAQNISLDLPAGRYAVLCFLSDRDGGKSHAEQGMLQELTVE